MSLCERIHLFCFSSLHPVACLLIQDIEGEAIYFIDQTFKTLRSASVAFDMLLKFKHIRSRESLNKQMMMKFNDILAKYCLEVRKHPKHLMPLMEFRVTCSL